MADQDLMNSQDPMQQQMVGTPPPFMQSGISPMMTGAPPQAGGVLPPSNPIDAAQGPQSTQASMQQMAQTAAGGPGQTGGLYGREQAAMGPEMGGRLPGLIQQREAMAGTQSWHPNFEHGQGAGGFFHNLGQALMALGAATRPGQAINAVTHSKQREEYAGLSDQIKSLQEQQKLTQETEPGLAAVPYHAAMVGIQQQKADTGQQRADTYDTQVASQAADRLVKEQQGWGRLTVSQQKQNFTQWYGNEKLKLEQRGQDLGLTKAEIAAQTGRSIAAAIQGNSYIKEHPYLYGIAKAIPGLAEYLPDMQAPEGAVTDTTKPGQPVPNAPSSPEASRAAGAPKVGEVRRGFRFKGGNPASQASWEKVGQ